MDMDGGRSRPDRERLVSLHPSSGDFPFAKQIDSATLAKVQGFSEPAKAALGRWILDYAEKLIEASSIAKQNVDGDNVSEANVNEAGYSLNKREGTGFKKLAGTLGGIFLGVALSTLVSIVQGGKFDRTGTIIIAVAGITGAFLIAMNLPQAFLPKRRKRTPSMPTPAFKVKRRPANQAPKTPKE